MKESFEDTIILSNLEIKNKELKKYIQFKLGKEEFKTEELKNIKDIILDGKTIVGTENKIYFEDVDLFTNLEEIQINNTILSREHTQKLKDINKITLRKCTIDALEYLSNVKKLSLISCLINEFEAINKLTQIQELELVDLAIEHFNFLQQLSNLKTLKIKNIKNFELGKIDFNLQIEYLSVENINTLKLEDIQKFTSLQYLSVDKEKTEEWKEELDKIEKKRSKNHYK